VGKHIVGHPRSYSSLSSESIGVRSRASTMPINGGLDRKATGMGLDKTTTAPPNLPDRTSPTTPTEPPPIDLETGQEVPGPKRHWWQRKRRSSGARREHPENTAAAHAKTPAILIKEILLSSWANALLIFVPVGIALHFVNVSPTVVFVMNFLAIVPLAGVC